MLTLLYFSKISETNQCGSGSETQLFSLQICGFAIWELGYQGNLRVWDLQNEPKNSRLCGFAICGLTPLTNTIYQQLELTEAPSWAAPAWAAGAAHPSQFLSQWQYRSCTSPPLNLGKMPVRANPPAFGLCGYFIFHSLIRSFLIYSKDSEVFTHDDRIDYSRSYSTVSKLPSLPVLTR